MPSTRDIRELADRAMDKRDWLPCLAIANLGRDGIVWLTAKDAPARAAKIIVGEFRMPAFGTMLHFPRVYAVAFGAPSDSVECHSPFLSCWRLESPVYGTLSP